VRRCSQPLAAYNPTIFIRNPEIARHLDIVNELTRAGCSFVPIRIEPEPFRRRAASDLLEVFQDDYWRQRLLTQPREDRQSRQRQPDGNGGKSSGDGHKNRGYGFCEIIGHNITQPLRSTFLAIPASPPTRTRGPG
jgi:hypothetical protein